MTSSPGALVLLAGLGCGVVGAATATDVVSLRALAHSLDIPLLSGLVIGLREAMPTSVAHTLEPATAIAGGLVTATWALLRASRDRTRALAWVRGTAVRTVLAAALLHVG